MRSICVIGFVLIGLSSSGCDATERDEKLIHGNDSGVDSEIVIDDACVDSDAVVTDAGRRATSRGLKGQPIQRFQKPTRDDAGSDDE